MHSLDLAEVAWRQATRRRQGAFEAWQRHADGEGKAEALRAFQGADSAADLALEAYNVAWRAYQAAYGEIAA